MPRLFLVIAIVIVIETNIIFFYSKVVAVLHEDYVFDVDIEAYDAAMDECFLEDENDSLGKQTNFFTQLTILFSAFDTNEESCDSI